MPYAGAFKTGAVDQPSGMHSVLIFASTFAVGDDQILVGGIDGVDETCMDTQRTVPHEDIEQ
jgi:hypothetical protein